jgi:hypothetical protein
MFLIVSCFFCLMSEIVVDFKDVAYVNLLFVRLMRKSME